jgi:hypothetical protein
MPGHLLHPRFHRRTFPTVYACRGHDAPAQASDRMAEYPLTLRVPRMARRQRRCGRSVDLRIRRRRRGVPHKGFVRVGHPSSLPGLRAHPDGPNVVLVESGRRDHLGAYGNGWIRTPNLDALAKESLRFIRPHPESRQKRLDGRTLAQSRKLGPAVHNPEGASETELKKRTLANSTTSARRGLRTLPG